MFLLVFLSKSKFFTRVTLMSFVQHQCRIRVVSVALVSLVSHSCRSSVASVALVLHSCYSCRTRVAHVWHSCCKSDQIKSSHSTNILKQLPISIETRLCNLSSNSGIFNEASKHYDKSDINLDMTRNSNANLEIAEIVEMRAQVNCSKISKETLSGSTSVFQR